MSQPRSIAVLIGSLRAASLSRKLARALIQRAPESLDCDIVEIGDLPLYNEDLDAEPPPSWRRFRDDIRGRDAILFVTPEYNRSIPGCLKNALDVGSRPQGQSVFDGMPAGVCSITPYKLGAFGANHALRQTFVFLNMPVMQQPEAYVGGAGELFDADGGLANAETDTFLKGFMAAFAGWVEAIRANAGDEGFGEFLNRRATIAEAYVSGDEKPLDDILVGADPATFFSPAGDRETGAAAIAERYRRDARTFASAGASRLEVLQSGASGDLAFWTGMQHARVRQRDQAEPVDMTLRITEIFRRENGSWKLAHRHADATKPAAERRQAAAA